MRQMPRRIPALYEIKPSFGSKFSRRAFGFASTGHAMNAQISNRSKRLVLRLADYSKRMPEEI